MNGNHGRSLLKCQLWAQFVLFALLSIRPVHGESLAEYAKARYESKDRVGSLAKVEYSGLRLHGGSELTIVSPRPWRETAGTLVSTLESTHSKYRALFGDIPKHSVTVRLLDEETFYLATGAPSWTNAMFFKGQIIIPVPKNGELDQDNLFRSIRHEYTHAIIHALTNGQCPGWLDEGLAQWAEGDINPLLTQALSDWLTKNPPVPFKLLQGGFTKLPSAMVPAAYSQSLYATKVLIQQVGIEGVSKFFKALREGKSQSEAFLSAMGKPEHQLETELVTEIPNALKIRQIALNYSTLISR